MRVRGGVVALVAVVAVAQGALLVLGGDDAADDAAPRTCPTLSAEEMAELSENGTVSVTFVCEGDDDCTPPLSEEYLASEKGQQYLREVERMTGSTDPSDWSGDAFATYFTGTCD